MKTGWKHFKKFSHNLIAIMVMLSISGTIAMDVFATIMTIASYTEDSYYESSDESYENDETYEYLEYLYDDEDSEYGYEFEEETERKKGIEVTNIVTPLNTTIANDEVTFRDAITAASGLGMTEIEITQDINLTTLSHIDILVNTHIVLVTHVPGGVTITAAGLNNNNGFRIFNIQQGGSVTLGIEDDEDASKITLAGSGFNLPTGLHGGVVLVGDGGTFTMHGGVIRDGVGNGTGASAGGNVAVNGADAKFVMTAGVIEYGRFQNNNGRGAGVAVINGATFEITNGTIRNNGNAPATNHGGGVYVADGSTFVVTNSYIYNNTANNQGGGVRVLNSTFIIQDSYITGNMSINQGGGIWAGNTIVSIIGSIFSENRATGTGTAASSGGAITLNSDSIAVIDKSRFTNNSAVNDGGAITVINSDLTLKNSIVNDNHLRTAAGAMNARDGGGIRVDNSVLNLENVEIFDNSARHGGAIFAQNGANVNIYEDVIIRNNNARGDGGAIHAITGSTVNLNSAIIRNNTATARGGGISLLTGSVLNMQDNSRIEGNTATNSGGGILASGTNTGFTMNGGVIYYNNTTNIGGVVGGGGIRVEANAVFTMNAGEIDGNMAGRFAGGVFIQGGHFTMNDGKITNNHGRLGGGVTLHSVGSTFTMYDGLIDGNRARYLGGGVNVEHGLFTMHNGKITNNHTYTLNNGAIPPSTAISDSRGGGGIFIQNNGTVIMNDGFIDNNSSDGQGGGVRIHDISTFTMNNGTISNNTARRSGGGINIHAGGTINMHGGKILDNRAYANNANTGIDAARGGGGVFLTDTASIFTMTGGTIAGNTAPRGGGVRVANGVFTINGGEIRDNNATVAEGGGVFLNIGTAIAGARMNMRGGIVAENTAITNGGGIFTSATNFSNLNIGNLDGVDTSENIRFYENRTVGATAIPIPVSVIRDAFPNIRWNDWDTNSPETSPEAEGIHLLNRFDINAPTNVFRVTLEEIGVNAVLYNATATGTTIYRYFTPEYDLINISAGMRSRYAFDGWTVNDALALSPDANTNVATFTMPDASRILTANWLPITYEVRYSVAGGQGTLSAVADTVAITLGTLVNYGTEIVFTATPAASYQVKEWKVNGTIVTDYTDYIFTVEITEETEVTVEFEPLYHDVTFNLHGGTGTFPLQEVRDGEIATEPTDKPNRTGYYFVGWYTEELDGIPFNFDSPITANTIIHAIWKPIYVYYTFYLGLPGISNPTGQVRYNTAPTEPDENDIPSNIGYIFDGWEPKVGPITKDTIFKAQWIPLLDEESDSSEDEESEDKTIEDDPEDNISEDPDYLPNDTPSFDYEIPPSIPDSGSRPPIPAPDMPSFITDPRIAYVQGFPDGTFRADNSITRAEISVILFRLISGNTKYDYVPRQFNDVETGDWYSQEINYLAYIGAVQGFSDGNFRPNDSITRAELAAKLSRFFINNLGSNPFSDVIQSHWAYGYISSAYNNGWLTSDDYDNLNFGPDDPITRAEVVTLINRVLNRRVSETPEIIRAHITERLFFDLTESHWAYYAIIEAAVHHEVMYDEYGRAEWILVDISHLPIRQLTER
ncbi:MAG: S-layer homology domain-containing protein [Defluviitaleaceae bacterium]|nr:S-layer homology domain-containing protein [Defluviitaleaceae bacterium]